MTLVVALLGMFLVPFLTFLSGIWAILVTLTAMRAALTLLPPVEPFRRPSPRPDVASAQDKQPHPAWRRAGFGTR